MKNSWNISLPEKWWQYGIIVGVFTVSMLTAFLSARLRLFTFAGVAGFIAAVYLLQKPSLGLIGLVFATQFISFGIGTGTSTQINAVMLLLALLLGLWGFDLFFVKRKLDLVRTRTLPPILAFLIIITFAFIAGQLPWFILSPAPLRSQLGGIAIYIFSFGAFLLTANQLKDLKTLKWMLAILFVSCTLYLFGYHFLDPIIPGISRFTDSIYTRGAVGSIFWVWVIVLALSQALINKKINPIIRISLLGLVGIIYYVRLVLAAGWTSGWLPATVGAAVIILIAFPRFWMLALLPASAVAYKVSQSIYDFILTGNQYSLGTRVQAWKILTDIISANPILGLGPSNYYWYTPLYDILGYHVNFNSHNNYIDIIAQYGLLGIACFLWLIWEIWKIAWGLHRKITDPFVKAFIFGCIGGLVGTLVSGMLGDWFLPFVYNVGFIGFRSSILTWIFLGALIAINHMYEKGMVK